MAYTSTDRANVEAAIIALARGQRIVTVRFDDGQTVTYSETDLASLRDLLGTIKQDINKTAGNKRFRHVITSKGY